MKYLLWTLAAVIAGGASWLAWQWLDALPAGLGAEFVGRQACIDCHQNEYQDWLGSHHDLAMDHANEESVLGDFRDSVFERPGVYARFFRKDGKFLVETDGRAGKRETFEIKYTFGVEPLQQYMVEFADGRVQVLPVAWDVAKKEWFYVPLDENIQPHEPVYWTNRGFNWNFMCADCHSTNLHKNYDPEGDRYATTWTDIDVSCEACHGPGSLHVQIARRGRLFRDRRYGTGLVRLSDPKRSRRIGAAVAPGQTTLFAESSPAETQTQLDVCGQCHARKRIVKPGFRPGERFCDYFQPELLDTAAYYPDGQVRDENYEYGSFHLSLMYQKGVACTDCHNPHSGRLAASGNALCTRCHLAGKYDAPTHHFHTPGGQGSLCVDCHMPETLYMKVDARRDHSFRIPRPDLTVKWGIPSACDRCHADKSPEWSAAEVAKRYGKKDWEPRLDFAAAIAGGRAGDPNARDALARLARGTNLPVFLRASALALLRRYPPMGREAETWAKARTDPQPLVRAEAVRFLENSLLLDPAVRMTQLAPRVSDVERVDELAAFLNDPSPLVRGESARILATIPKSELPGTRHSAFDAAIAEYIASMKYLCDDPAPNHNLGNLYAALEDFSQAEHWYLQALRRDPGFNAARFNLAMLYNDSGRRAQALSTFREVLAFAGKEQQIPDAQVSAAAKSLRAQTHYFLGLLLAEDAHETAAAAAELQKAVELDPSRHRAFYNLGLARQKLGDASGAERALRTAFEADPNDPDYAYALAILYAQRQQPDAAVKLLEHLIRRHPQHAAAAGLLNELSRSQRDNPGK